MASIRQLREEAGFSQRTVAERARISQFRLSFIECGYLTPDRGEELALRDALSILMKERAATFYSALQEQL